jgi:hypothetical protein
LSAPRLAVVALGYAVGLAPAIGAWAERFVSEPRTRYALAFPALTVIAMAQDRRRDPAPMQGLFCSIAALGIQVAAILAGLTKAAVLALPVAVLAYARLTGVAGSLTTALSLFCVPLPYAVASLGLPERVWGSLAAPWLGPGASLLHLTGWDSGVTLAALFAGLSWYVSARAGLAWPRAVRNAALWSFAAAPAQLALVGAVSTLATLGAAPLARSCLSDGPWVLGTLLAVGHVERRRRRERLPRAV